MKKSLLVLLMALMLLAMCACGNTEVAESTAPVDPTEPPETTQVPTLPSYEAQEPALKNNVYQITEPCHLIYMAEHPNKSYALAADIDMYGYAWTPVEDFSGKLSGKMFSDTNYTISNLVIEAKEGEASVGLFRTLSGTVTDIIFQDITVTCSGTFTGNMGVVAGVSKAIQSKVTVKDCTIDAAVKDANVGLLFGKAENVVTNCNAAGEMNITLAGGTDYIGGGVGYAENGVGVCKVCTDITVKGTGTSGAAGGILGYSASTLRGSNYIGNVSVTADAAFTAGTLVGNMAGTGVESCTNSAWSFTVTGAAAPVNDVCGTAAAGAAFKDNLHRDMNYTEKKLSDKELALRMKVVQYMYDLCTVQWSPAEDIYYTDGCGGNGSHNQTYYKGQIYFGMPYTHRTASFEKFLHYLGTDGLMPEEITSSNVAMVGNDCADAIYWAWSQISAQIKYVQTHSAICVNGIIPVGNYQLANNDATKDTCTLNGAQGMYEAYACIQPGDAVLYAPGHIRLAAEAAYVYRNADGTIDGLKSYIVTHEQGAACAELPKRHSTCLVNAKYTFASLFQGNYIPITIEAFGNAKADEIQVSASNTDLTKAGVAAGTVTSNYRINYVTVEILDAKGKVLLDAFGSPDVNDTHITTFDLAEFKPQVDALSLTAGQTYTYKVTLCVASQEVEVQSFQFTA